MKLYANYILERLGQDLLIIPDTGFATYKIEESGTCYISNIYVEPQYRKQHYAKALADTISEIAKRRRCTLLLGSVDLTANHADRSVQVLESYGMKRVEPQDGPLLFFRKDL